MHMGNLLCVGPLRRDVMAATSSRLGIDHVTVVPTNLRPEDREVPEAEAVEATDGAGTADAEDADPVPR